MNSMIHLITLNLTTGDRGDIHSISILDLISYPTLKPKLLNLEEHQE